MVRNFFCFLLGLVGFILSILGLMGTVKKSGSEFIVMLIIGVVLFCLGVMLAKYKKQNTKKMLLGFFAGIIAITVLIGVIVPTDEEKRQQEIENAEKWKEEDNHIGAYVMVQKFVKEKLKSPSTAKFPSLDYKYQTRENHVYYIEGYVDSQNSFGATVRTEFAGTIQQVDKDKWKLLELAME